MIDYSPLTEAEVSERGTVIPVYCRLTKGHAGLHWIYGMFWTDSPENETSAAV